MLREHIWWLCSIIPDRIEIFERFKWGRSDSIFFILFFLTFVVILGHPKTLVYFCQLGIVILIQIVVMLAYQFHNVNPWP